MCSSTLIQTFLKIKIGDGYIQIDKVVETKTYLEVTVYNASTEYVRGIVTIIKATNFVLGVRDDTLSINYLVKSCIII